MLFRFDLTNDEAVHSRWLRELCRNVSRPDFVDVVRCWDEFRLTMLSRRVVVMKPAESLDDFRCLYYGDELQERFGLDFTGKTLADIEDLGGARHSIEPYLMVAKLKAPHVSRVLRTLREQDGVDYTRIIHPVMAGDEVRLVVGILLFHDDA